jgi:uncharacterized damage-inducible protein DinB
MEEKSNKNAVEALLSEYRNVIIAFQNVISPISYANLTTIVDSTTSNADCQSIQTIITHVVSSGYSYAGYIRKQINISDNRPGKVSRLSITEFHNDFENLMAYTQETFKTIEDDDLEEFDEEKKIQTSWGQVYDIEQMMEHAVVHVLRHRRQIEKYMKKLTME